MPRGYLWRILENLMPEGYNLDAHFSLFAQAATTHAPSMVHVTPVAKHEIHYTSPPMVNALLFVNDEVYRLVPPPSEIVGFYDRLDDF